MLITLLIPYLFQKSINLQQPVFSQQRKQHCTSKATFCRGELQSKWETNEMEENIQYWTSEFHCKNISGPLLKFRENERPMDSSNHQQTAHNRKSWTMCPLWSFTLFFSYKHFKPSNFDSSFTHHFPKCLIKIYCL